MRTWRTRFETGNSPEFSCAACALVKGGPRHITYTTAKDSFDFEFTGSVIVISNEDLSGNAVLGAVASRMRPLAWHLQPDEIEAIIRDSARKGLTHRNHELLPTECREVAEFVIAEMKSGAVDLRTYFNHAIPSYWHWKHTNCGVHWTDVVRSKIVGKPVIEKRHARVDRERAIACECYRDGNVTKARLELWTERTGWSMQAFYNRLREAKQQGMFDEILRKNGNGQVITNRNSAETEICVAPDDPLSLDSIGSGLADSAVTLINGTLMDGEPGEPVPADGARSGDNQ